MKKFIAKIKKKLGWYDCPSCKEFVRLKFIHVVLLDPEEPPMFGRWECPKCKWMSCIWTTRTTEISIRKLGYTDSQDFYSKRFNNGQKTTDL